MLLEVAYWIGAAIALVGALLTIVGAFGALRFPDFYTRAHAVSITDTFAGAIILLGLALMSGDIQIALKLGMVWIFIMLTSPTASHALAHAAFKSGHAPWIGPFRLVRKKDESHGDVRGEPQ